MKITCLDQDGKRQFRRSYDIDSIAVDLPNNDDFIALQRELRSHENDNTIHAFNTEISHDQLKNLQIADNNVYWGHVTNTTQSIYGDKSFYGRTYLNDGFETFGTTCIIAPEGDVYGHEASGAEGLEISNNLDFGTAPLLLLTAGLVDAGLAAGENTLLATFITYTVTGAGYPSNTYHIKLETTDPMNYTDTDGTHYGVFTSLTGSVNIPRGIAYYANVTSFVSSYSFYGANGNIYNNGDVDITGVYKISGVTISGGDVFTMFENTFLSNNYFQGVSASTLIVSDITATNVSTSYFNTTHITTSNILSTNSSITYQSSSNVKTTYLSTAYLSTTNFLTTYLTATNIYASTVTTTGNIYCGASLTAVQTLIAKNGIQLDSGEYIGYGTTGAAPTGGLQFNTSNNATFSGTITANNNITAQRNTFSFIVSNSAGTGVFSLLDLRSSGGTLSIPTVRLNGDTIGQVRFMAYDGTDYRVGAILESVAVGNWSGTNRGTSYSFSTCANGSTTTTARWVISDTGMFRPYVTNTYDIGTTDHRARYIYVGTDIYTPMLSSTNILTTYLTTTNIYTSYITSTSIYATNATITNISASNVLSTNSSITYQSSSNLLTTTITATGGYFSTVDSTEIACELLTCSATASFTTVTMAYTQISGANLDMVGVSSNISLGSNYISYDGTDAGLIFTSTNKAVFSSEVSTTRVSTTNIYSTYITSTNIYTSTLTATSNVSISGKLTASSATFGTATDYTNFEADGTMVMYGSATVYNDIQYAISSGRVSSANYPDWSTFNTKFGEYQFDVGDYIDLGSQELPHWWKEGTEIEFHIHWANSNSEALEGDVAWQIYYTFAKGGSAFSTYASLTGSGTILTTDAPLTHYYTSLGTTTLSSATIGTQLKIRLYRISGDPIANNPFALQVGVHAIADTIGSRSISTK